MKIWIFFYCHSVTFLRTVLLSFWVTGSYFNHRFAVRNSFFFLTKTKTKAWSSVLDGKFKLSQLFAGCSELSISFSTTETPLIIQPKPDRNSQKLTYGLYKGCLVLLVTLTKALAWMISLYYWKRQKDCMPYRACKMLLAQRLFSVAYTDFFSSYSCSQNWFLPFWRISFLVFWSSKHSLFFQFLSLFFLAVKLKLHFFKKAVVCMCFGIGF